MDIDERITDGEFAIPEGLIRQWETINTSATRQAIRTAVRNKRLEFRDAAFSATSITSSSSVLGIWRVMWRCGNGEMRRTWRIWSEVAPHLRSIIS